MISYIKSKWMNKLKVYVLCYSYSLKKIVPGQWIWYNFIKIRKIRCLILFVMKLFFVFYNFIIDRVMINSGIRQNDILDQAKQNYRFDVLYIVEWVLAILLLLQPIIMRVTIWCWKIYISRSWMRWWRRRRCRDRWRNNCRVSRGRYIMRDWILISKLKDLKIYRTKM